MIKIKKLICIGSNCIAADITHTLKLRIVSPVDNISNFNIWKSHLLFSGKIKRLFFNEDYDVRPSTNFEKEKYFYFDKVFTFNNDISIVHNNFEDRNFKKSLKKRISAFKSYYKLSLKDNSLWYIYSLNQDDSKIDESLMQQIIITIPKVCQERLICLGVRGKNALFEKYFKYYMEFNEENYIWGNYDQASFLIKKLEEKYDLHFEYYK